MNSISFNPNFSNAAIYNFSKAKENNNTEKNTIQKANITELPSFCARKPLTEDQKCKKLLLDALTERGTMRFVTKDEIHEMMKAIKQFKTTGSKSELLSNLLSFSEFGRVEKSYMSSDNIRDYFKYMSGKPASVQKMFAQDISKDIVSAINRKLEMLKNGEVTCADFIYLNNNLSDTPELPKDVAFSCAMKMAERFPNIMKHKETLTEKINLGLHSVDNMYDIANHLYDQSNRNIMKIISRFNAENLQEMDSFIKKLSVGYCKNVAMLLNAMNQETFDYIKVALEKESVAGVVNDLAGLKKMGLTKLPQREEVENEQEYFERINKMLDAYTDADMSDFTDS